MSALNMGIPLSAMKILPVICHILATVQDRR